MSMHIPFTHSNDWNSFRCQQLSATKLADDQQGHITLEFTTGRNYSCGVEGRPILRSHKSFSHAISPSSYPPASHQAFHGQIVDAELKTDFIASHFCENSASQTAGDSIKTINGKSAPTSPISRLTPVSAETGQDDFGEDEDDFEVSPVEMGTEESIDGLPSKTAAERRAEKRKMKRFRLTHNQTRFLMSEFTRQAHPDAAQRERLSREIPGLSPRQVQVWFQNRRAKLKRLTSDDREHMMKSRALPDDFDVAQTLYSPFETGPQTYSPPVASPSSYAAGFVDNGMARPLVIDGLRRPSDDDTTISPVSMTSYLGTLHTPPGSLPSSEMISPLSPDSERLGHMNHLTLANASPRNPNPFARSSSFSAAYRSHPHIPRLQIHDRITRSRADSLASPLRSSMSYTGNTLEYGEQQQPHTLLPLQASPAEQPRSNSFDTGHLPYSSAFPDNTPIGFQSAALARPRSTATTFPPGLDLRDQYRPGFSSSHLQQIHPSQGFQSAPLAVPPDFQLPHMHGSYQTATINASYSVTYGGLDHHGHRLTPTQEGISRDQSIDEYTSGKILDSQIQEQPRGRVEDAEEHTSPPEPDGPRLASTMRPTINVTNPH